MRGGKSEFGARKRGREGTRRRDAEERKGRRGNATADMDDRSLRARAD